MATLHFFTLIPIYSSVYAGTFLKCQHQNKEAILSATLGLPIGKIVTDYCSMLVLEAVCFSQELYPP